MTRDGRSRQTLTHCICGNMELVRARYLGGSVTCPVAMVTKGTLATSGETEGSLTEEERSSLLLPPLLSCRLEVRMLIRGAPPITCVLTSAPE